MLDAILILLVIAMPIIDGVVIYNIALDCHRRKHT